MVKYTLIAFAALMLVSCGSSTITTSARGTLATINLKSGQVHQAELLALQDSVLIAETDSLMVIRQEDVRSVELQVEHEREGWIILVGATEVLPSTVLLVRGASESNSSPRVALGIVGLAISAGTVISLLASEPQETFTWPLTAGEFDELRLRTRFPYGISPVQIEQIRAMRHPGK
jgi:hypothetical protein